MLHRIDINRFFLVKAEDLKSYNMADTSAEAISAAKLRDRLSQWDAIKLPLAALSETQKDSYMDLSTVSGSRPFPNSVSFVYLSSFV